MASNTAISLSLFTALNFSREIVAVCTRSLHFGAFFTEKNCRSGNASSKPFVKTMWDAHTT